MFSKCRAYIYREDAAVTVDWVVLTAFAVSLVLGVIFLVSGGAEDLSTTVGDELTDTDIRTDFGFGSSESEDE